MVLNPLVSLFGRLVACSGRKRGNRQTNGRNDRPSTVTLAAHARRGSEWGSKGKRRMEYAHAFRFAGDGHKSVGGDL